VKRNVSILTNIISAPAKDNFYDVNEKSLKSAKAETTVDVRVSGQI
jgi:hypothetical protein